MLDFLTELKRAVRRLRRTPGFSIVAVLTLTLGIGATTAIFAVLNSVVLKPLPYPGADRLIYLDSPVPGLDPDWRWGLSVAGYFHFREHNRTLEDIGAYGARGMNLTGTDEPRRITGAVVSHSFLRIIGARAASGRLFDATEDAPGATPVAVLDYGLWRNEFGGTPDVIGRSIRVDGRTYEVVGVMAKGIELPETDVDVWLPMQLDPAAPPMNAHWVTALARLRTGQTLERAQSDLSLMTGRFPELFPSAYSPEFMRNSAFRTDAVSLRDKVIGDLGDRLWILLAAVGIVLLIACANVANLFLVRGEVRRREVALRAALGASRGRLAWHFVAESLVLVVAAAALGLLLADALLGVLVSLAPENLPRLSEIGIGTDAILFTLAIAAAAGLAVGAFPLLRVGGDVSTGALTEIGRGMTPGRQRHVISGALVVAQVTLALILVAAAGLMVQSFRRLQAVDPGIQTDGVLTFQLYLPSARYDSATKVAALHQRLAERLEQIPGVRSASTIGGLPFEGWNGCSATVVPDDPSLAGENMPCLPMTPTAPGFFETMGISILEGREFEVRDTDQRSGSIVVSRALADRLWPGGSAIGKELGPFGYGPPRHRLYRVVGIADDVRGQGLDQPPSEMVYLPLLPQGGQPGWSAPRATNAVVRTASGAPTSIVPAVRQAVAELDPEIPVAEFRTMNQLIARSLARTTLTMTLLGVAAGVALLLGAVGLYGVMSYVVSQRTAEIGIRMALGARAARIATLLLRQSLVLVSLGVALGLLGAVATTRVLRSLLFEVSPTDPITLAMVSSLVIGVAIVACLVPARRATRVDPVVALRTE